MSEVTLEAIKAKQTELADLIAKFTTPAPPAVLHCYREFQVLLKDGERYAGPVLDADGGVSHHLVLMAEKPDDTMTWKDALAWAALVGGSLPTRQEAALIFANCKPHVGAEWHWTSEEYEGNDSYAWYCYFSNGSQGCNDKDDGGTVRAVRRVNS